MYVHIDIENYFSKENISRKASVESQMTFQMCVSVCVCIYIYIYICVYIYIYIYI